MQLCSSNDLQVYWPSLPQPFQKQLTGIPKNVSNLVSIL